LLLHDKNLAVEPFHYCGTSPTVLTMTCCNITPSPDHFSMSYAPFTHTALASFSKHVTRHSEKSDCSLTDACSSMFDHCILSLALIE